MGDAIFSKRINELLKENFLTYGTQLTPVQQAEWPAIKPGAEQINVTSGETTPLDAPRTDIEIQNAGNVGGLNGEAMGEVSSLLISIGYLLSKEGIVPDKFDIQAVVKFLNDNFNQLNTPTAAHPEDCGPQDQTNVKGIPQSLLMQYGAMAESRKLFESRFKK